MKIGETSTAPPLFCHDCGNRLVHVAPFTRRKYDIFTGELLSQPFSPEVLSCPNARCFGPRYVKVKGTWTRV